MKTHTPMQKCTCNAYIIASYNPLHTRVTFIELIHVHVLYMYMYCYIMTCIVTYTGPEFEGRIRQNEAGNPKFNFLNNTDPYHAYYQHKIKEIQEGVGECRVGVARRYRRG